MQQIIMFTDYKHANAWLRKNNLSLRMTIIHFVDTPEGPNVAIVYEQKNPHVSLGGP